MKQPDHPAETGMYICSGRLLRSRSTATDGQCVVLEECLRCRTSDCITLLICLTSGILRSGSRYVFLRSRYRPMQLQRCFRGARSEETSWDDACPWEGGDCISSPRLTFGLVSRFGSKPSPARSRASARP